MGKASRAKRRRAAVRSAKRSRNNNAWYALTALIVIVGIALVVYSKNQANANDIGPYVANQNNASDPHNKDSHWHAALGVYDCDHWVGDLGNGTWAWPTQTAQQSRAQAGNPLAYAGLHSHEDGIIHLEPAVDSEAGRHATVGKYFEYGGWKISPTAYDFDGTHVKNGDKCGNQPGTVQWETARFNGDVNGKQTYVARKGNPGAYKLLNDDIVVIAFLPPGKTLDSIGNPPSLVKLPDAASRESSNSATPNSVPNTAPSGSTPGSSAPASTGATATTKP